MNLGLFLWAVNGTIVQMERKMGVQIVLAMQDHRVDVQMANKYVKRYLTSLVSREMQIRATMREHFILTRMALLVVFFFKCW